jgi:hypothetical protein
MRKQVEYEDERKKYHNTRPILKPDDIADGVVYVLFTPEHKEDFFSGSMCFVNQLVDQQTKIRKITILFLVFLSIIAHFVIWY